MIARQHGCDPERLAQLLDDRLPEPEATRMTKHIETCCACRDYVESLAAEASWWHEASQCLAATANEAKSGSSGQQFTATADSSGPDAAAASDPLLAFLTPSDNPRLLGHLGAYEILEVVGRGGMGIVLKAYDRELGRFLAIKVLAPYYACSAAARQRFAREAQAAAAVVHQHVVPIHAVDATTEKLPYLVMPYMACESLQERIDRIGVLELRDILRIGMQIAEGLAAAHAQGLVHRDVKPANILLEKDVDRVLLTDFGLARTIDDASLTCSGIIAGTPQFMSPEQARGLAVDHRTDLFSLGSVIYTMCAGRPPFRADTALGVLRRISDIPARPIREINSDIPPWLSTLLDWLLAKEKRDRCQSAVEIAQLLERCLAHVQHPTSVTLPECLQERPTRLRRAPLVAAGGLLILFGALLAFVLQKEPDHAAPSAATVPEAVEPGDEPLATRTLPDPALQWNDRLDNELDEIGVAVQRLEREANF